MKPTFNNSNQIKRILYRFTAYKKIALTEINAGVPIIEIIKTKFPYYFKDNLRPISLNIEFGNVCNLRCQYCNVPLYSDKREFISDLIFEKLVSNLKKGNIGKISVGGGEPTLHPNFNQFCTELRKHTNFLQTSTNAQWTNPETAEILINTPFDLVMFSMDAGGKEIYEKSRIGANYELFEANLKRLKALKENTHKKVLICLTLMIRPSTQNNIKEETTKWKKYCDFIMPQYILKIPEAIYEEDIFIPFQREKNGFPKCTLPFKNLLIKLNGDIPFCQVTGSTIERKRIIAGNILNDSISDIWNNKIVKMRNAHRKNVLILLKQSIVRDVRVVSDSGHG